MEKHRMEVLAVLDDRILRWKLVLFYHGASRVRVRVRARKRPDLEHKESYAYDSFWLARVCRTRSVTDDAAAFI